jgi:hypothetical protein
MNICGAQAALGQNAGRGPNIRLLLATKDYLAVGAVQCEPVSAAKLPTTVNFTGKS